MPRLLRIALSANLAAFSTFGSLAAQVQTDFSRFPLTLGVHLVTGCARGGASAPMAVPGTSKEYCLQPSAVIDQTDVTSAAFDQQAYDKSAIKLTLKTEAAQRLGEVTRKNIGNQVGVVLNGELVSVATIAAQSQQVWIGGLGPNRAAAIIKAFQQGEVAKISAPALPSGRSDSRKDEAPGVSGVGVGISPPFLIKKQNPEYTPRARAAKIEGRVVLDVLIEEDGRAGDVKIVRALDPDLDAKAIECVRSWRFRPAMKDGKPVPVRATLDVAFHL